MDNNITWITVKGRHVPIKKGQSKEDAINEAFGFVRFGSAPNSGKSTNHITGGEENGISAFEYDEKGFNIHSVREGNTLSSFLNESRTRTPYAITGEKLKDAGFDGEPLFKNPEQQKTKVDIFKERERLENRLKEKFEKTETNPDIKVEHSTVIYTEDGKAIKDEHYKGEFKSFAFDENYSPSDVKETAKRLGIKHGDIFYTYGKTTYFKPKKDFDGRSATDVLREKN